MRAEPALHVVADPDDSVELARMVAGLADRAAGRAVVHPTPRITSPTDFAADLLMAVGKRFDALRFEHAGSRAWPLVQVWFQAEEVRHLFVLRAARLGLPLLNKIVDAGGQMGLAVWLIGAHKGLLGVDASRWDTQAFGERWAASVSSSREVDEGGFPEVPDDDFVTFRSTCRRLLDPLSFERVDRVFCQSMDSTARGLEPRVGVGSGLPMSASDVATQLQGLLVSSSSAAEALTRLRGAQAAYFLAGWLVSFPASECRIVHGMVPLGPTLDPVTARRLRRLCDPSSTAAMALLLATDLRSAGLSSLNISDIDHEGAHVTVGDDHRFVLPPYARSLVRSLLIERVLAGGTGRDPLFACWGTGERFHPEQLKSLLRKVCGATALAVGLDRETSPWQEPASWLRERRLDLLQLNSEEALVR